MELGNTPTSSPTSEETLPTWRRAGRCKAGELEGIGLVTESLPAHLVGPGIEALVQVIDKDLGTYIFQLVSPPDDTNNTDPEIYTRR